MEGSPKEEAEILAAARHTPNFRHAYHAVDTSARSHRLGQRCAVVEVDWQRVIGGLQARRFGILVGLNVTRIRIPGRMDGWDIVAAAAEDEDSLGDHGMRALGQSNQCSCLRIVERSGDG